MCYAESAAGIVCSLRAHENVSNPHQILNSALLYVVWTGRARRSLLAYRICVTVAALHGLATSIGTIGCWVNNFLYLVSADFLLASRPLWRYSLHSECRADWVAVTRQCDDFAQNSGLR